MRLHPRSNRRRVIKARGGELVAAQEEVVVGEDLPHFGEKCFEKNVPGRKIIGMWDISAWPQTPISGQLKFE